MTVKPMSKPVSKYRLFDWTDIMAVSYHGTKAEANKAGNQFFIDTDGDCSLTIERYNPDTQRYEYFCDVLITRKTEIAVYGE